MLYEFCADGTEKIEAALRAGAGRMELCYGLQVGGLTPDEDSVVRAKEICDAVGVPLMCMIRPRSGPFEYSDAELEYIEHQARWAIDLGVSGLVLGMTRTEDAVPYMSSSMAPAS